jgi:hypothetical protein
MKYLFAALALAVSAPAFATGVMTCNVPKADHKPQADLVAKLTKEGWQVRKAKPDGGCYEVYGTTPEGDRVEAYFDPATFEKLYVARRGEVLFKKAQ